MHKNRLLMSLVAALSYGAVACGGADDSSVDEGTESLRWGRAADGGAFDDESDDSDEDSEESAQDGGKRRGRKLRVREDGGCSFGGRDEEFGGRGGRGQGRDRDEDSEEDDRRGDRPLRDGGSQRGLGWIDGGARR